MAASEIEKLERLVRENPKGRLFASLADAYRKDGQYPKALEVLDAGLKHHPDYVSARVVLGRVHMGSGDRAKAREAFSRVVELDPESVIALKALADLAEEEGQGDEALRWSGQLLTVDPGNDEAIKQQERLTTQAKVHEDVRLSGIVPVVMEEVAEHVSPVIEVKEEEPPPAPPPARTVEITVPAFPAITVPMIALTNAPSFTPTIEPLEQSPEPLPLMPLSEEAQTEATAGSVTPMEALEPTAVEGSGGGNAATERMAGLETGGLSDDEAASIGAAVGFEPTSGPMDVADLPRSSLLGLETISGELVPEAQAVPEPDGELEREQEIEIGASGSNEFQESSAAETLQRRSGVNEFQVASDADTLDATSARASEAIETGGTDLAFIEPDPEILPARQAPKAPVFTPAPMVPEDPEPAVREPEPVVTEAMAELYSSQGHLVEALDVYRQLAARDPNDPRYTDRIVELEMFVGGAAPVEELPTYEEPEPAARPAAVAETAGSLDEMELVPLQAAPPPGRVTVGAWLADIFSEALPGTVEGAASEPVAEPPAEPPAEAVSDVAPRGAPTRPASGGFSLSNVFGEERAGAPAVKSGSFDDFFGAPAATPPTAPAPQPGSGLPRSTRPSASAMPPSDDDLSSFQGWLKGLKK